MGHTLPRPESTCWPRPYETRVVRFLKWLNAKVESCDDLEERVGLKSLVDVISQVVILREPSDSLLGEVILVR